MVITPGADFSITSTTTVSTVGAPGCFFRCTFFRAPFFTLARLGFALAMVRLFQLRIGINTGYCTVGNFGSEDRMDYTIIGSEVNLASRLQSHAELGGILLSHETYSLIKDHVVAEERTPIQAKGIAKPVRNYAVIAPIKDLVAQGRAIHEEQDGLRLLVDLQKLDKEKAVKALEGVLRRLMTGA
jgi:adenylate cyclase